MDALIHLLDGMHTIHDADSQRRRLEAWLQPLPLARQLRIVRLLFGITPAGIVRRDIMLEWARTAAALPAWLFDASAEAAGDAAETAALLCHGRSGPSDLDVVDVLETIDRLPHATNAEREATITALWAASNAATARLINRLLLGTFRPRLNRSVVAGALGNLYGVDADVIAWRCRANWPAADDQSIIAPVTTEESRRLGWSPMPPQRPMPLAPDHRHTDPHVMATWHEAGDRFQWHIGAGQGALRTEHGTLVVDHPVLTPHRAAAVGVDAVLDVTIPHYDSSGGRRVLVVDVLAYNGIDLRTASLDERLQPLPAVLAALGSPFVAATPVPSGAALLALARQRRADGMLLRQRSAPYAPDRPWDVGTFPPLVIRTVLYYAHRRAAGSSPRYGDYGLAVRTHNSTYVTVARLRADVPPETAAIVDDVVAATIVERAGPVHTVVPQLVVDVACTTIKPSRRHKAGVVLVEPHLVAIRPDLGPADVHTVADLVVWAGGSAHEPPAS